MSDCISRQAAIDEGMSYINGDCFCDKEDFAKYIEFIDAFPMNAAGKVLKYKMREDAIRRLGLTAK